MRFQREPTIYVLSKDKKNIIFFHLKIIIFTAVKFCSILLHVHVCVIAIRLGSCARGRCNTPYCLHDA